jgi:hypothetical protein
VTTAPVNGVAEGDIAPKSKGSRLLAPVPVTPHYVRILLWPAARRSKGASATPEYADGL